MRKRLTLGIAALGALGLMLVEAPAQVAGTASLEATLLDYNGSSAKHWTVVWIASESGAFIKTVWRQGPSITATHWNNHCSVWYAAKSGSTAFDGYSSATAANYTGTNSPVRLTWNGLDAVGNVVPDGNYKFWLQYAEDSGQGPATTGGLLWTKGPAAATNTYANQGANFANMRVIWIPTAPPRVPPTITSAAPPAAAVVGVPYVAVSTATGSESIGFAAAGLPPGLQLSPAGLLAGVPESSGTFNGTLKATNGTPPDASQPFSIVVSEIPTTITSVRAAGVSLVMSGAGPPLGVYSLETTTNLALQAQQWTRIVTGNFDSAGQFGLTNAPDGAGGPQFYRLRIP